MLKLIRGNKHHGLFNAREELKMLGLESDVSIDTDHLKSLTNEKVFYIGDQKVTGDYLEIIPSSYNLKLGKKLYVTEEGMDNIVNTGDLPNYVSRRLNNTQIEINDSQVIDINYLLHRHKLSRYRLVKCLIDELYEYGIDTQTAYFIINNMDTVEGLNIHFSEPSFSSLSSLVYFEPNTSQVKVVTLKEYMNGSGNYSLPIMSYINDYIKVYYHQDKDELDRITNVITNMCRVIDPILIGGKKSHKYEMDFTDDINDFYLAQFLFMKDSYTKSRISQVSHYSRKYYMAKSTFVDILRKFKF